MEQVKVYVPYNNFEDQVKSQDKSFVLFTGSKDANGVSWCSDCVQADPFIENFVVPKAQELNIKLFVCEVGARAVWKDPEHLLRKHSFTKVNCVPTLIYIENGKVIKKLEEEGIYKQALLEMFLEDL